MVSLTVHSLRFPAGTSVGVYSALEEERARAGHAPGSSPIQTQTVAADGSLTFSLLPDATVFYLYALVAGENRWVVSGTSSAPVFHYASSQAVASKQNPGYVTPAGTTMLELDANGNLSIGPNEILDKTPGASLPIADGYYSAAERRLLARSMMLTEVNDPVDCALARVGAPRTKLAQDMVSLAVTPIPVAGIGDAFAPAGQFACGASVITYTGKATIATHNTTVAATLTPGGAAVVTVDTTGMLAAPALALMGQDVILYTGKTAGTLTGVQLYSGDGRRNVVFPIGTTVKQEQFTGCARIAGAGGGAINDTVEQDVYPVPTGGSDFAGVSGDGQNLGRVHWRAATNPDNKPFGSGAGPGLSNIGAHIYAYTAEPARQLSVGSGLLLGTTPIGAGDPANVLELTHDGCVRISTGNRIGPNALGIDSQAKLVIEGNDVNKPVLELRQAAGQNVDTWRLRKSDNTLLASFDVSGNLVLTTSVQVAKAAGFVYTAQVTGDAQPRWQVNASGNMQFGDGAVNDALANLYRNATGNLKTDGQFTAVKGVITKVKAGTPVDGDFNSPADGLLVVDSSGSKFWVRVGGNWKGVAVA